jgi:hypothetical protein
LFWFREILSLTDIPAFARFTRAQWHAPTETDRKCIWGLKMCGYKWWCNRKMTDPRRRQTHINVMARHPSPRAGAAEA